jgi:hypothetical protein
MFGVVLYCLLAGQIAAFGKINITCFASGLVLTIDGNGRDNLLLNYF